MIEPGQTKIEILRQGSGLDHAARFLQGIAGELTEREDQETAIVAANVCELHAAMARVAAKTIDTARATSTIEQAKAVLDRLDERAT